jgi:hypothetical protein
MFQPNAQKTPAQALVDATDDETQRAEALGDILAGWILAGQSIGPWPGLQRP